jgi:hypothetical protein
MRIWCGHGLTPFAILDFSATLVLRINTCTILSLVCFAWLAFWPRLFSSQVHNKVLDLRSFFSLC